MVKSKSFGKKLLALFLAVLMALTCFTGVLTAYASTDPDYHDDNLLANALGWVELSDDQTLAATVDYLDDILAGVDLRVNVNLNYGITIKIDGAIDSVSGVLDIARQAQKLIDDNSTLIGMAGDAKNVTLKPLASLSYSTNTEAASQVYCGKDYRAVNSSKEILKALLTTVYRLTANWGGGANGIGQSKAIVRQVLSGNLSLGIVGNFVDVYDIINKNVLKGIIGEEMPSGYQSNLVFNIVCKLLTNLTDWYTEDEKTKMYNQVAGYELDVMLFKALNEKLMKEINVEVTYSDGTSSRSRYENGQTDPHLFYTEVGNVYIFQYDSDLDGVDDAKFTADGALSVTSNLWDLAFHSLETAWKTVLQPTLGLLDAGVKDYDNGYHKWFNENADRAWNYTDIASNYTTADVTAWAATLGESVDDICDALTGYARTVTNPDDPSWSDIESSKLFNELRYSPLVEYFFNDATKYTTGHKNYLDLGAGQFTTGPMNATLACTGSPNIDAFMDTAFTTYPSIISALNDFLVAAVKDFLPGFDASTLTTSSSTDAATIATNIVGNVCKFLQYICDATDANILAKFYLENGANTALTEQNIEGAMIPFVIALIGQNFGDIKQIHPAEWDRCVDAEGVAYVVLKEYLAYVLPDKDYTTNVTINSDGEYVVGFENTIIPMCRDAVGYVIAQYVPVEDGNGNYWSIYNETTIGTYAEQQEAGTDIFTLLNSVVDYYGNQRGVAALLGCVDASGNSKVYAAANHDIWANIDAIANHYLPVLGELQYGTTDKEGQFDSYDLIWNDIIQGVLNIGAIVRTVDGKDLGGVSNLIYRLVTIFSAPTFSSKHVINVAYDLVEDLLNGIFDPHQSSQTYYGYHVIPDSTSTHPFHDLIQVDCVTGNSNNGDYDLGIVGRLIVDVVEAFNAGAPSCTDTMTHGMCFVIYALTSFINGFIPQLADYTVGDADVKIASPAATSYSAGKTITNTITVENLGHGINRFLPDGAGGTTMLPRSYVKIVGVAADKGSFSFSGYSSTNYIAPEDTLNIGVSGSLASGDLSNSKAIVTFTISYQFVKENGQAYDGYSGTYTKQIYLFVTGEADWYSNTYSSSTTNGFTESFSGSTTDGDNGKQSGNYSSLTRWLNRGGNVFGYKHLWLQYPNNIVIKTSQLDNIDYTVWVQRTSTDKSIDTILATNSTFGTNYFAVTCDPKDGAITNCNWYDYYQYETETFTDPDTGDTMTGVKYDDDGEPVGNWVTNDPKSKTDVLSLIESNDYVVDYRFHHVRELPSETGGSDSFTTYTHTNPGDLEESKTFNTQYLVDRNEDGTYNAVYVKKDSDGAYKGFIQYPGTWPEQATPSSGVQGIFISFEKMYQVSSDQPAPFLKWDGETQVKAQAAKDVIFTFISYKTPSDTIKIAVADESDANDLTAAYVDAVDFLNSYSAADMADYANGSSATYTNFKNTVLASVEAANPAITVANADKIGSIKANLANTVETTSPYGDVAYSTATAQDLAADGDNDPFFEVRTNAYPNNGVYYQTKYTTAGGTTVYANPVYNATLLTDAEVNTASVVRTFTVVEDEEEVTYNVYKVAATDVEVVKIKGEDDPAAVWHLANAPLMEKEWTNTTTAPYKVDTATQATNAKGEKLYSETSFVYRDSRGAKTSSTSTTFPWVIKIAEVTYDIIDDAASRGTMKIAIDKLAYASELAYDQLNVTKAQSVFTNVLIQRSGLNNVNFNVVKYENMAKAGREAESLISYEDCYDYYIVTYNGSDETGARTETVLFSCLGSEFEDTLIAYNTANGTDYEAKDIQSRLHTDADGNVDYSETEVTSKSTNFALSEAERLYNVYLANVTERGYVGDKLEEEISCAANGKNVIEGDAAYVAIAPSAITVNTADDSYTVGGVTYTASSNKDEVTYTEDSWGAFIDALDAAVTAVADSATYAHKDPATYVASDKDNYTLQVSDVHAIRQALMNAENNLEVEEPVVPSGYTVSALVGYLASQTATAGKQGTKEKLQNVVITIVVDGETVTADYDNSTGRFTFTDIPDGTYEASLTYTYGLPRTFNIVVDGADVISNTIIGVACGNFKVDNYINAADLKLFKPISGKNKSKHPDIYAQYFYMDIDGNDYINAADLKLFKAFSGKSKSNWKGNRPEQTISN